GVTRPAEAGLPLQLFRRTPYGRDVLEVDIIRFSDCLQAFYYGFLLCPVRILPGIRRGWRIVFVAPDCEAQIGDHLFAPCLVPHFTGAAPPHVMRAKESETVNGLIGHILIEG